MPHIFKLRLLEEVHKPAPHEVVKWFKETREDIVDQVLVAVDDIISDVIEAYENACGVMPSIAYKQRG